MRYYLTYIFLIIDWQNQNYISFRVFPFLFSYSFARYVIFWILLQKEKIEETVGVISNYYNNSVLNFDTAFYSKYPPI